MTDLMSRVARGLLVLGLITAPLAFHPVAQAAADTPGLSAKRPPQQRRVARPDTRSLEYRLGRGQSSIHADRALVKGLDGSSVTVAMIDAGMTPESLALFANVSPVSVDLGGKRPRESFAASHARQTATILAAPLDGPAGSGRLVHRDMVRVRDHVGFGGEFAPSFANPDHDALDSRFISQQVGQPVREGVVFLPAERDPL